MSLSIDTYDEVINPLDSVEEMLLDHNWVFDRMHDDELIVEVSGKACTYKLFFTWHAELNMMRFCCQYNLEIKDVNLENAASVLMKMNDNSWVGHFEISRETCAPSLRHTCFMRGFSEIMSIDHIQDLVDMALAQCERYQPVFHLLSRNKAADTSDLFLALLDTRGEA